MTGVAIMHDVIVMLGVAAVVAVLMLATHWAIWKVRERRIWQRLHAAYDATADEWDCWSGQADDQAAQHPQEEQAAAALRAELEGRN